MPVIKFARDAVKREYGINCHRYLPIASLDTPFGATHCVVAPGEATAPHDHHEGETFFIASGAGVMEIAGQRTPVAAGDVVYIPARSHHVLKNESTTEPIVFFSVWWDDASTPPPARTMVTSAPPTPNGDLHLGHLSGPYVAADVHARYLRSRGASAAYLSGSDDNQSYVETKGRKLGKTALEVAEHFGTTTHATLERVGARVDYFLRPGRTPEYVRFVQSFFHSMIESGALELRDAPSLYCENCSLYLYEAHVKGGCPHCKTGTSGNGCEQCGRTNDCVDLIDPACSHCSTPATRKTFRRYYFPLSRHAARLQEYHRSVRMSPHLQALTTRLASEGYPDISVTHVASWGIPAAREGLEGQVIYEWFEMAAGYLFSAAQLASDRTWESYWKSPDAQVVQFFGWDNGFFYTSFIPAVLAAYDAEIRLPAAFVSNEFYRLDGLKFSTSRNHAIWGDEMLAHVPADVVRFALAYDRPETEQTNFTLERCAATVEGELVGRWERWLSELSATVRLELDGRWPAATDPSPADLAFQQQLVRISRSIGAAYEAASFSLRVATRQLCQLVEITHEYSRANAFLRTEPSLRSRWHSALALELTAAACLARLASPLMPEFAATLGTALGLPDGASPVWTHRPEPLPAGTRIASLATTTFSTALAGLGRVGGKTGR